MSQSDPFYHDCFPDAPPLPITDSIHHSTPIPDPSAPIDSTILEEHFIDLLENLSVFVPNDITTATPDLTYSSLSIVHVIEPIHATASPLASPVLCDPLHRRSTRVSRPPTYLQ